MSSIAVDVRDLCKIYNPYQAKPFIAVDNLNVSIPQGQVVGFLGPNGAGKTTTVKMICGLITPTKGNIYLHGYHINKNRNHAMQQIGVVLEGARNIYWQLSAWQNLRYYGRLKGTPSKLLSLRAEELLKELDLWDRRHELVGELSRGLQQRVAVACSLIANPPIIILDEPTLALDIQSAHMIQQWIQYLAEAQQKTIIITTHQLDIAEQICKRVIIMNKSKLIADKSVDELIQLYKDDYYQIIIQGIATSETIKKFDQFTITYEENKTILCGPLKKTEQLYPLIDILKAKGLALLSATKINKNLEDIFLQLINDKETIL